MKIFDGNGRVWQYSGVEYDEIVKLIETNIKPKLCPMCKGRGFYSTTNPDFWEDPNHGKTCPLCHDTGRIVNNRYKNL